jgi:hypothetical protein
MHHNTGIAIVWICIAVTICTFFITLGVSKSFKYKYEAITCNCNCCLEEHKEPTNEQG